jgi:hypothetical protein
MHKDEEKKKKKVEDSKEWFFFLQKIWKRRKWKKKNKHSLKIYIKWSKTKTRDKQDFKGKKTKNKILFGRKNWSFD